VLVLGMGGGDDVRQALRLGAQSVDAVERNPQVVALLRDDLARWTGALLRDPRVRVHVADARGFVRATGARWDLVVLAPAGSFAAGGAGVQAVAEDYASTVEALREDRARLVPGGVLAITRWEKQPPRDALKLFATAAAALRADGVADPGARLAMLRNWDAATLLLARDPFTSAELARLRAFAEANGFDAVHYPGMAPGEANRFQQLARPEAALGARALLSPHWRDYLAAYQFDIAPARDDRPWFGNFFRFSALPELWRLRAQGAAVLLDSGTLLLWAALAQALPLALLLVLLPLRALPRATAAGVSRGAVALYFAALGLAFLFVEIACLARLALLVGQPLLAFGSGLAGFLLGAGAGSAWVQRWPGTMPRAWFALALALAWHLATFALALPLVAGWPPTLRVLAGLATVVPLAFAMGLPFALGLRRLARLAPALVPWAWGLNGCASVVAAIAALLVALQIGLVATLLLALSLYGAAAIAWCRFGRARVSTDRQGRHPATT